MPSVPERQSSLEVVAEEEMEQDPEDNLDFDILDIDWESRRQWYWLRTVVDHVCNLWFYSMKSLVMSTVIISDNNAILSGSEIHIDILMQLWATLSLAIEFPAT